MTANRAARRSVGQRRPKAHVQVPPWSVTVEPAVGAAIEEVTRRTQELRNAGHQEDPDRVERLAAAILGGTQWDAAAAHVGASPLDVTTALALVGNTTFEDLRNRHPAPGVEHLRRVVLAYDALAAWGAAAGAAAVDGGGGGG